MDIGERKACSEHVETEHIETGCPPSTLMNVGQRNCSCKYSFIKEVHHEEGLLCAAGDETVTLQEVEGTTITLHTGITGIQSDAQILWLYGPEKAEEKILISQVFKGETVTEISERFKERLQLDRISGALTIRNISRNLSGVYLLHVLTGRLSSRTFSVSVYECSHISRASCVFSCPNRNDHHLADQPPRVTQSSGVNREERQEPRQADRSYSLLPALISTGVFLLLISIPVWVWLKRKHKKFLKKLWELTYTEVEFTARSAERVKKEEDSRITDDDQEQKSFVLYSVMKRLS
ncbi:uncharacterized protein LOC132882592 [Neoarius graeffei]|uniref:uncharacterized protein LOC132882592 n=1 Tax=Neoarius graeffei TaxID=443677 RepID=UPI00298CF407|nr:uncharacterized protein LOC132882592 [Neoarius graeffei]